MAAYTPFNFSLPATERSNFQWVSSVFDVAPNFNGIAGPHGNWSITGDTEDIAGALWTAHYAGSPNIIVIQFTAPLQIASTTIADYTLSGPSAPSVTSVAWNTGSRSILLNLSGALVSSNTYTLAIAPYKVLTGNNWTLPQGGVYNLLNFVVDVIQPLQIDVTGAGISQIIDVGTSSSSTNDGSAIGIGISQSVDIGTLVANSILSSVGVGIEQTINVGSNPAVGLFTSVTSISIEQLVTLGDGIVVQQQQPWGVGIAQVVDSGSPVSDITPITPIGVGEAQFVFVGNPEAIGGPVDVFGGLSQDVGVGAPIISMPVQSTVGVGVEQVITVGVVNSGLGSTPTQLGVEQVIEIGEPTINLSAAMQQTSGVGISQPTTIGVPVFDVHYQLHNVGISQLISVGAPLINLVTSIVNTGIQQDIELGLPTSLTSLIITTRQHTAFLDLETALQKAFGYGVAGSVDPDLILAIQDYLTVLSGIQQSQTKNPFKNLACATWVALNIPGTLSNTNASDITIVKKITPIGINESLTFTDGILTSRSLTAFNAGIGQSADVGTPAISIN